MEQDQKSIERSGAERAEQAIQEIYATLGVLQAQGGLDEEIPLIQSLLNQIESGKCTPESALAKIRAREARRGER